MFENIISLIDVVIWPFISLVFVLILRKPIKSLLPLLRNLKYKDLQVEFSEAIDQIKEDAEGAGLTIENIVNESNEILKLAKISPNSVIIESWKDLEIAARRKVEQLAPKEKNYRNHLQRPISFLEYKGAIVPTTSKTIRDMQILRNKVTHTNEELVSTEDALEYSSLSKSIATQINMIKELPNMRLTGLTFLIIQLNSLIDSGEYTHISIDDVHKAIEQKRIIPYLNEIADGDVDLSLYDSGGSFTEFTKNYNEEMYSIYGGYAGNERRKWGVEKQGLCLLLAWTNEIVQQGAGWYPRNLS